MANRGGGSIRVSEKHGVNPSLDMCFWCGEARGVALMGKMKGDVEAPRECVTSYDPCDKCAGKWAKGTVLIEADTTQQNEDQPPIQRAKGGNPDLYPTGRFLVVPNEAAAEMFTVPIPQRKAFMDSKAFDMVLQKLEDSGATCTDDRVGMEDADMDSPIEAAAKDLPRG